jgi:predicted aspartyl protease
MSPLQPLVWSNRCRAVALAIAALLGAGSAGCHAGAASGTTGPAAQRGLPAPLARFHAVSGGARWDAVTTIETTSTIAVGGLTGTVASLEDARTGRYKSAVQLGGTVTGDGFDGTASWQQAMGGEVVTPDAPEAVRLAVNARWFATRGYFRATGARYRERGDRTLGDRRLHVIEATPEGGAPVELWLDAATGLLAQTVHQEGRETITTRFDDYRPVDGVQLAFRTTVDSGDPRNLVTVEVTAAHLRPPAAAAEYARPHTDAERLSFAGGAHSTQLPFELINNHIYIRAQVDGQPVRMIVDTGGLNVLTPAAAARIGLTSAGKMAIGGVGDRKSDVGLARARELAVGDVRLAAPVFYVLDFEALTDVEGEQLDGLVGFELFQRLAVRIDYPGSKLTLTRRDDFVPPGGAIVVPFEMSDRTPIAAGSIDGIPGRFTIDTGARNSLTAHSPFVRAHNLEARYRPAFETIIGWGVGGPSRAKPVRFKQVKLGDAVLTDVAGELFTGDKGAMSEPDTSANLGGGILRRFVVTFDYRDRKMFLEPGPPLPRDIYDRAGMFLLRDGDAIRIAAVVPGGPAAKAGLAVDDRIVAIDGAPVASRSLAAWRAIVSAGAVGERHTLTVVTAGKRRERALVLAELLP